MASDRCADDFASTALPLMDQVYTTALYLTRNRDEADDLLQETFLRAFRFWAKFTPGTNCKAWLLTILHNVFRNRYRERQREQQQVEFDDAATDPGATAELAGSSATPEEHLLAAVLDGEVQAALQRLPPDYLDVVVLVDVQELTYEEAASALGCPVGTVRSRLSRARTLLHRYLRTYAQKRGLLSGAG